MNQITQTYRQDSILAMPREQILLKLYDSLLLKLEDARQRMEGNDRAGAGQAISQALSIVAALREARDHSVQAEATPQLDGLYQTISTWLLEANRHQAVEPLESSCQVLSILKEGWDGAVRELS